MMKFCKIGYQIYIGGDTKMEIIFQILIYILMGIIHCLTLNFFLNEKPSPKDYILGITPFWGNFYMLKYRKSICGTFYAILRPLEYLSILLVAFFSKSSSSNIFCWILIGISFFTVIFRIVHICATLWECWTPVWMIGILAVGLSLELIYIFGILPYTLQELFL